MMPPTSLESNPIVEQQAEIVISPEQKLAQEEYTNLMTFSMAKIRLTAMITDFSPQVNKAKDNWKQRFREVETAALRAAKKIPNYAHMIPVRAIDSNIRREQPSYVNYLKGSRRLAIFKAINNPSTTTTLLEDEFTRGLTYSGWEIPFFKVIDGAQTHGWDWLEVMFDLSKPFHVGFEQIGHDRLIFPLDAADIQACEVIIRAVVVTPNQLKIFVRDYGFSQVQVDKIVKLSSDPKFKERSVTIYKKYCKYNGIVHVGWFSLLCDDWLLAPAPLFLGRRKQVTKMTNVPTPQVVGIDPITAQPIQSLVDVPTPTAVWEDEMETLYPIFLLPYNETAQQMIATHFGRVFMDKPKQEALTANLSQFLSGCQLAATPVASVDPSSQASSKDLENQVIGSGKIINVPLKWANIPYPEAVMLSLQTYLDTFNSQESGQVNYAANNRQDSKKTATEVSAAKEDSDKLANVGITLFSRFLRDVWTFTWNIVQNRAVQGKITLLYNLDSGGNNVDFINQPFDIRAAGDIDVVKKQELLMQYKDFWPIIKDTPVAMQFLAKMLVLTFPEDGNFFAEQLMMGDPRILVGQLAQVLTQSIDEAEYASLTPENQMNLKNLLVQAEQMAASVEQSAGINNNPTKQPPSGNVAGDKQRPAMGQGEGQ